MSKNTDHVVVDFKNQPAVHRCLNCGKTEPFPLPMDINLVAKEAKRFIKLHKNCEKQKESE